MYLKNSLKSTPLEVCKNQSRFLGGRHLLGSPRSILFPFATCFIRSKRQNENMHVFQNLETQLQTQSNFKTPQKIYVNFLLFKLISRFGKFINNLLTKIANSGTRKVNNYLLPRWGICAAETKKSI